MNASDRQRPLEQVKSVTARITTLQADRETAIAQAVTAGATWAEIGAAAGVSAQHWAHTDAAGVELLQRAVANLLEGYPGLHLTVQQRPSAELVDGLAACQLDLAILRPPLHHAELNEEHLYDEQIVALLPDSHPLAGNRTVSIAELIDTPFIIPPRSLAPATHDAIFDICRNLTGKAPSAGQEAADSTSFFILVAAGTGVALLPIQSTRHLRLTGITALTLRDQVPPLPLHVAWRRDTPNPVLLTLRQNLQHAARRLRNRRRSTS
jgi:DNA-binding transcriptional LysR family regulator